MKTPGKILSVLLTASIVLSMTACSDESGNSGNNGNNGNEGGSSTTSDPGPFSEATAPPLDETAETGTIKYYTYETTFESDNAELIALFKDRYNGTIAVQNNTTSLDYSSGLGTLIASGDSPDMIRYETWTFPHGASYNMFTPVDDYLDLESDMWKDMAAIAEQYVYNGKHFYVPYRSEPNFVLNYNNRVLQENGIPDPYQYVKDGTWDWAKFEEMLKRWQDIDPVNHVSYNGVGALAFVYTTGVKPIDVRNGDILNNLRDPDINRCMQWLEGLRKQYLVGASPDQAAVGVPSGFIHPDSAFQDGNLLFLGMGALWAYRTAKEALDKANIPNEMKFVPYPRDPNADKWYQLTNSFGYLIPAGAQNVKGTVDWMYLIRGEETDPENIATAKEKDCSDAPEYYPICSNKDCNDTVSPDDQGRHTYTAEENAAGVSVCPSCGTERRTKYKVVWSEEMWDLYHELMEDGKTFTLLYDFVYGFNNDFKNMFVDNAVDGLMDSPVFGELNYANQVEVIYGAVEGYLQPYRDRMAADARGEEVTTTPPAEA